MLKTRIKLLVGAALIMLGLVSQDAITAQAHWHRMTYDEVYAIAAETFGEGPVAHRVTRIAMCESLRDPYAHASGYDRSWRVWYDFRGLMQVDWVSHRSWIAPIYGDDPSVLWDPWVNMSVASIILDEQGWGAWPYCSRVAW